MPELAEVETVVRTIRPLVWGCEIIGLMQSSNGRPPKVLPEQVKGQKINHISRVGKYILFKLDDGYLISHLRMTGQWYFTDKDHPAPNADKHFRWGFTVRDLSGEFSGFLWFKDARKFGTLEWVPSIYDGKCKALNNLGPDGLLLYDKKIIYRTVVAKAKRTKRPIKNFLLDQGVIAGCGNIYASEVLFESKISPFTPTRELSPEKIESLCLNLYDIFQRAIDLGGSSISDYEGGAYHEVLRVYGRENESCFECSSKIQRTKQAGRSTFFCPKCQGVEENEVS